MSKQLRELQARKAGLIKEARALTDRAAAEVLARRDAAIAREPAA